MEVTGREALSVILARRQQAEQGMLSGTQCGDEDSACEIPLRGQQQQQQASQPQQAAFQDNLCGSTDEDTACEIPVREQKAAPPPMPIQDDACGDEDTACEIPVRRK